MEFTAKWMEEGWLLIYSLEGNATLPEYETFLEDRARYLDAANGHIYIICDWSKVSDNLPKEVFQAMIKSSVNAHTHLNCGVMAVVGNQALLKFIAASLIGKASADKSKPAATQVFNTLKEAEDFCRYVASVDTSRATTQQAEQNKPAQ
jgi:hypothetical protein